VPELSEKITSIGWFECVRLACKISPSIGAKTELTGGTKLTQKVKLYFGNEHSQVLAQLPVNVPDRRGGGRYGAIQSGMPGPCWPLRDPAQRVVPPVDIQPDSCSSNVRRCFGRRTSLEIETDTGRLRIGAIRELNQSNALALQRSVNAVLTDAVKTIELDLSQTVFLDSHGLGALIALRNMMGRRKGVVRLLNPSRLVEQVLELTRLHRVLDIVKCEESLAL